MAAAGSVQPTWPHQPDLFGDFAETEAYRAVKFILLWSRAMLVLSQRLVCTLTSFVTLTDT